MSSHSLAPYSLAENEAIVERNLAGFRELGNALKRIHDGEQYREVGYEGWIEYLNSKPWGISNAHARRQIEAAEVIEAIAPIGATLNESQARELAPLMRRATDEVVRDTFAEVVAETGGLPTARAIRTKVQEVISQQNGGTPKKKRSKVDEDLEHHLSEIKKLIPRWESRFVDSHSGKEARKRVKVAEEIAEWLIEEYVPAHAALTTPLAKIPT